MGRALLGMSEFHSVVTFPERVVMAVNPLSFEIQPKSCLGILAGATSLPKS